MHLIGDSSYSVCGSACICMNMYISRGVRFYSEAAGKEMEVSIQVALGRELQYPLSSRK